MNYEVEQKFPVDDLTAVERRLIVLGAEPSAMRIEIDLYFAHPARDFAQTDEALRLRRTGQRNKITYKGPKIDPTTKTRQEIDLPLPDGHQTHTAWSALLESLGFRPVGEVRKERRKAFVAWEGRQIEVSLDVVDRLGAFVELEIVTAPDDLEAAKACIASLAHTLNLTQSQRRSYLELLLEKRLGKPEINHTDTQTQSKEGRMQNEK